MLKKLILSTLTICSLALCSSQRTATKKSNLNDPKVFQATVDHIKKNVTFDNFKKVALSTQAKLKTSKAYCLPLGINIYSRADLVFGKQNPELVNLTRVAPDIDAYYVMDIIDHVVDKSSIAKANLIDVDSKHKSIAIPGVNQHLLLTKTTNALGYSRTKAQLHNSDGSFASPILKNTEEDCADQHPDKIFISKCGKLLVIQFSNFNGPNGHWNNYKYSFYKKRNFNHLKFDHQIFIQAILNEFAKTGLPVHVPDNLRYMLKALPDKIRNLLFENGYLAGFNKYNLFNKWFDRYTVAGMAIGAAIFAIACRYKLI